MTTADFKQRVAWRFGRAAPNYDQAAAVQRQVVDALLALAPLPQQPSEDRLAVDLGAGTGYLAACLQALGWQPWALDLAAGMCVTLRARGLPALAADAEALPLASGSVAWLGSSYALQWCPAPERAVAECARVLAPGGELRLALPVTGMLSELAEVWQAAGLPPRVNRVEAPAAWLAQLEAAGLTPLQWQLRQDRLHFPDLAAVLRHLRQLGANESDAADGGAMSRADLRALSAAYEERREAAGLPLHYVSLLVRALKPALVLIQRD